MTMRHEALLQFYRSLWRLFQRPAVPGCPDENGIARFAEEGSRAPGLTRREIRHIWRCPVCMEQVLTLRRLLGQPAVLPAPARSGWLLHPALRPVAAAGLVILLVAALYFGSIPWQSRSSEMILREPPGGETPAAAQPAQDDALRSSAMPAASEPLKQEAQTLRAAKPASGTFSGRAGKGAIADGASQPAALPPADAAGFSPQPLELPAPPVKEESPPEPAPEKEEKVKALPAAGVAPAAAPVPATRKEGDLRSRLSEEDEEKRPMKFHQSEDTSKREKKAAFSEDELRQIITLVCREPERYPVFIAGRKSYRQAGRCWVDAAVCEKPGLTFRLAAPEERKSLDEMFGENPGLEILLQADRYGIMIATR